MDLTRVAIAAGALLLFVVAFLAYLWATQRGLLYFPDDRPVPAASVVLTGAEDVSFTTEDGLLLRGWLLPARPAVAAVLVLNGNGGNRSDRAPLAAALAREGLSVLLFDYRGYGGNPGSPTEAGLLRDARAAASFLAARESRPIAYFGESLGAAVAVELAVERAPLALVLRSPFDSLAAVGRYHYPYLPVHPLLLQDRYASVDAIGRIGAPLLVIVGEGDRVVPESFSRALYDAAPEPKRYVVVPGGGHNSAALLSGEILVGETVGFVREAASRAR